MKSLLETSTTPEKKDFDRLEAIKTKSGGNEAKAVKLATQMAKLIKDKEKMQRRYLASVQVFGKNSPVTACFANYNTPLPLPKSGNEVLTLLKDSNPSIYTSIITAFKTKGLNFESINASKIKNLSQEEAFKYGGVEGDKYFKVWMVNDEIAFCTWANTMIDDQFKWNHKGKGVEKRNYSKIIGTQPHIDGYFKSNSYLKNVTTVYMMPFEAFGKAAIEMVEDERSKFLNAKNAIDNEELVINQINIYRDAKKYFLNSEKKFIETINAIDKSIKAESSLFGEKKLTVKGLDLYGGEHGNPGICHNWMFTLDLGDGLSYGKYDWDGRTTSKNVSSYDYAKAELKRNGIKMSFATDCKRRISEWIKKVKALPIYTEFMENLNTFDTLNKAYNTDSLIKVLKGKAISYLSRLGRVDNGRYFNMEGVRFNLYYLENNVVIFAPAIYDMDMKKTDIIKKVKKIAEQNKDLFNIFKQEGTTVPALELKPEIAKTLKKA